MVHVGLLPTATGEKGGKQTGALGHFQCVRLLKDGDEVDSHAHFQACVIPPRGQNDLLTK